MPTGPVVPADDADGLPGAKTGRRLTAPGAEEADGAGAPLAAEAADALDGVVIAEPADRTGGSADRARPPEVAAEGAEAARRTEAAGGEATRELSAAPAFGSPGRATMGDPERAVAGAPGRAVEEARPL